MRNPSASERTTPDTGARPNARRLPRAAGALLLVLWSLALRWPMLGGPNFTPDAAEYLGMARRMARGKGLTTALKWHFLDNAPVVRPAGIERPVLYPLVGAAVLRAAPRAEPLRALQTANAILSAANAVVAVVAFRTVVSVPAAWLGGFLLPLLPPMTQTGVVALSEQLFLLLWLAALALLPRVSRPRGMVAFGVLVGLAALARPIGLLLLLAPAALSLRREERRAAAAGLGCALGGTLLVLAPAFRLTAVPPGPGYRPAALVNFMVPHVRQASWRGYGREMPSPVEFIHRHPELVKRGIAGKLRRNAAAVPLSLGWLWVLLAWAPLAARRDPAARPGLRRAWWVVAAANYAASSLSWVAAGALRYMLPTTALLLPFALHAGLVASRRRLLARLLFLGVMAATLLVLTRQWEAQRQRLRHGWGSGAWQPYRTGAAWIRSDAAPSDVVASNNPWMLHYLTENPAIVFPHFPPGTDLTEFARRFGVRWVLLFTRGSDPRVRRCLGHPAARRVRGPAEGEKDGVYLFKVSPGGGGRAGSGREAGLPGAPSVRRAKE